MKIDKGFVNLMTRSLRQGWSNSADTNQSLVLSLWSGAELDTTALNDIRNSYVLSTGRIQSHWVTNYRTNVGSVERARLALANFNDRYETKPFNYVFDFSKRSELFSILSAGTVASFTLMLVGTSWSGYTNAAANDARLLISGTVGLYGSGADLELSAVDLLSDSRIRASAIKFVLSFNSYENSWNSATAAIIDPYWATTDFLAKFDNNLTEVKTGTSGTVPAGSVTYNGGIFGSGSFAAVFDGNTYASFAAINMASKSPLLGDFTYEAWITPQMTNVTDTTSTFRAIWGDTTAPATSNSLYVYLNGNKRSAKVLIGTTEVIPEIPNVFLAGVSCHIAVQRLGTKLSIIVNGWKLKEVTNSTSVSMSSLLIGASDAGGSKFIGSVDAFRFTRSARYENNFYFIDKQPDQYVTTPTAPNNDNTVSLVDFGVNQSIDIETGLTLNFTAGASSPVISFDGEYAVFNGTTGLTTSKIDYGVGTSYTVEVFFWIASSHNGSGDIFGFGTNDSDSSYFYINGTDIYFADGYPYTGSTYVPGEEAKIRPGVENHLAMVFDGTYMRCFINGRKIYEQLRTRGVNPIYQRMFLGSRPNALSYPFTGKIRCARISSGVRYIDNFTPEGKFI